MAALHGQVVALSGAVTTLMTRLGELPVKSGSRPSVNLNTDGSVSQTTGSNYAPPTSMSAMSSPMLSGTIWGTQSTQRFGVAAWSPALESLPLTCKCFADSGAERKDVDETKSKIGPKEWRKTTNMEPNGCPKRPTLSQKGAPQNNRCSKIKPWIVRNFIFFTLMFFVKMVKRVTAHLYVLTL